MFSWFFWYVLYSLQSAFFFRVFPANTHLLQKVILAAQRLLLCMQPRSRGMKRLWVLLWRTWVAWASFSQSTLLCFQSFEAGWRARTQGLDKILPGLLDHTTCTVCSRSEICEYLESHNQLTEESVSFLPFGQFGLISWCDQIWIWLERPGFQAFLLDRFDGCFSRFEALGFVARRGLRHFALKHSQD